MYPKLRKLLAILLVAEAVRTGIWLAALIPSLSWRGYSVLALAVARAAVGAVQMVGGALLYEERAPGVLLARIALISSAVLLTLEIGLRLMPSDVDPSFRWWIVGAYWMYAVMLGARL